MSFWNRKKESKAQEKESEQTKMLRKVSIMTNLMQHGLLYIDVKEHRVIISDTLAVLYLSDKERWINFLSNLQMWFVYQESQLGWQKVFLEVERKAVKAARQKFAMLTPLQERTIRAEARQSVEIDHLQPPAIKAYDFIISSDVAHGSEPRITAVGRYENGKFDMIPYDSLKKDL